MTCTDDVARHHMHRFYELPCGVYRDVVGFRELPDRVSARSSSELNIYSSEVGREEQGRGDKRRAGG